MSPLLYTILVLVPFCYCATDFSDSPRNFSIELLHYTAQQTDGHVVISPFGVWTLMTGVTLGATGKSYEQLRNAFILPRNFATLRNSFLNLTNEVLKPTTTEVTLTSRNYMFIDKGFEVNPTFKSVMQADFSASVKVLDFKNPAAAAKSANSYIQNSGSNVLTSDDFANSRLILSNVISFKGLWGLPFNKTDTVVEDFHNENRQVIGQVNMMYQKAPLPFSSIKELDASVLELPYARDGKYSMLIILPRRNVKVADVYAKFTHISLKDIFAQLAKDTDQFGLEEIDIRIPRFKISTNVVLNKPLNDMGVYDIFDPIRASFERVSKEPLFVSAIVHKADIEVTESGTVASASTTADFADRIMSPNFTADKPFIYFIVEKTTTTIIFSGIYSKPTVF